MENKYDRILDGRYRKQEERLAARKKALKRHPDIEWAMDILLKRYPELTDKEAETLYWSSLMECYLVQRNGMTLGIEIDGDIHS